MKKLKRYCPFILLAIWIAVIVLVSSGNAVSKKPYGIWHEVIDGQRYIIVTSAGGGIGICKK